MNYFSCLNTHDANKMIIHILNGIRATSGGPWRFLFLHASHLRNPTLHTSTSSKLTCTLHNLVTIIPHFTTSATLVYTSNPSIRSIFYTPNEIVMVPTQNRLKGTIPKVRQPTSGGPDPFSTCKLHNFSYPTLHIPLSRKPTLQAALQKTLLTHSFSNLPWCTSQLRNPTCTLQPLQYLQLSTHNGDLMAFTTTCKVKRVILEVLEYEQLRRQKIEANTRKLESLGPPTLGFRVQTLCSEVQMLVDTIHDWLHGVKNGCTNLQTSCYWVCGWIKSLGSKFK